MRQTVEIKLLPKEAADETAIRRHAAGACRLKINEIDDLLILKRSIDARGSQPLFQLRIEVFSGEKSTGEPALLENLKDVSGKPEIIIVGAGPGGYFAALELI
ncbi:MAG: FAD-binding protein, partial [Bacteroidota bacterium]